MDLLLYLIHKILPSFIKQYFYGWLNSISRFLMTFVISILSIFISVNSVPNNALFQTEESPIFDISERSLYNEIESNIYNRPFNINNKNYRKTWLTFLILFPVSLSVVTIQLLNLSYFEYTPIKKFLYNHIKATYLWIHIVQFIVSFNVCHFLITALRRNFFQITGEVYGHDEPISKRLKSRVRYSNKLTDLNNLKAITTFLSFLLAILLLYYQVNNSRNIFVINLTNMNFIAAFVQAFNISDFKYAALLFFLVDRNRNSILQTLSYIAKSEYTSLFGLSNGEEIEELNYANIILPCILLSICYKFDIWQWHRRYPETEFSSFKMGLHR